MPLDLSVLNPEQKTAVEQIDGPCMIIAGAGSGKTRVLTYKVAHLVESGVSPYNILALTFTNKAANEMKERVAALVSVDPDKIWMGTFHSIFARLLRMEAERIGFTRNFTIYDTDDSINVIKQIMSDSGISTEKTNPRGVQSNISYLKNKLIYPDEFSVTAKTFYEQIIEKIYPEYQRILHKNNAMDFDDLLMKPIELFEKHPDVLEKYQDRFKFLLIDEYQDTNKAQYIISKMLAGKYKNISVVGDDAQSIYKWRGAEIQNIFDFESDFSDSAVVKLEQNYRSTQNILTFAGCVIKKNTKQIEKNLWTDNNGGEEIHILETMTDKDEAARITKYISQEIHKRKLNFGDFAVLYRTNAQSRILEESFRQNGIPYIIVGGIRFYQRKEIKDILCHLKIIVNQKDDEAMQRVLNLKTGVGKTTVEKLSVLAAEKNIQLSEAIKLLDEAGGFSSRTKNLLLEILNFINKYSYLKDDISLSEVVRGVIDEMGILKELRLENTAESDERVNNINELISAVAEYEDGTEDASLENFLQQVSLVADIDEVDNKKNAVTLMTIHSSKGLEYPVVFITGLEEGLFPVSGAINTEDDMEEERRLFYVAVTRAKEKLYISYANQRYRFGIQQYQMKSRFLKEIDSEVDEKNIVFYERLRINRGRAQNRMEESESKPKKIALDYNYYEKRKSTAESPAEDKFPDVRKGVNIYHDTFGKGTVISVSGKGLDKKADIYFDDIGLKKIILKYAKMRVECE
ncbi:MAG: UvrD-helicase domain-containing protein [Ignavibacteriae bacterium]|nr:UvrD-helicase domain-containing protein [Ignavibacteriota bacterium]